MPYIYNAGIMIAIIAGTLILGYIIRGIFFSRLSKWSEKNNNNLSKIIISAVKGPIIIWFLMLGIYLALGISKLPENIIVVIGKILLSLGVLSITLVLVNLSAALIIKYSYKFEHVLPLTSLTHNISRIVIFGAGALIILDTLGIPISPILATLGVGGLAVALGLQDTLGNVFAGFYIVMSRQIRIGDYVKLESGEEGYVSDITWRTTQIKALSNYIILIPNEKLTKTIANNYYLPDKEMSVSVQVGVHYDSDLNKVEKVTAEVAREVMKEVKGGVPEFEPFIRFHTLGDSSIDFSVILRAKEFTDQYLIKHEFLKRLIARYAKEGIIIPYPIRAINYTQEKEKN